MISTRSKVSGSEISSHQQHPRNITKLGVERLLGSQPQPSVDRTAKLAATPPPFHPLIVTHMHMAKFVTKSQGHCSNSLVSYFHGSTSRLIQMGAPESLPQQTRSNNI